MALEVVFRPESLATANGDEPARLVFGDGRLVAVIVPISPEDNESDTEAWYLEVGFGRCRAEGLMFASLPEVEKWVQKQLQEGPARRKVESGSSHASSSL